MTVRIGSAISDENNRLTGGKAGDQTGKEVKTQAWYLHSKGWKVFRAKDPKKAELIAENMQKACDNNKIGYDQSQNSTLYDLAKNVGFDCGKVTEACETDCAKLVRICVLYAGIQVRDFYTGNEANALTDTGEFEELTDHRFTTSENYLERGDILVTKTQGHTVVVLSNGIEVKTKKESGGYVFEVQTVKEGTSGSSTLLCQKLLKASGFKGANGKDLILDGECGSNTVRAINAFQTAMRKKGIECGTNGKNDGSCGNKCWKALLGL